MNVLLSNYSDLKLLFKIKIEDTQQAGWSLNTLISIEDFSLKNEHRWRPSKSQRIILASRHVARRTNAEKSATSVIRRQKGIIVRAGNNVVQVPGPVTSVSAHARMPVVLKIYNPVGAYGATGFKSRPLPARNRFNAFRGNKTKDPGHTDDREPLPSR